MRNYGIQSARADLGGKHPPAHYSADTRADSKSPDDRELSALIFAGLCASPLIVFSIILFYLAS
jgi:hypothetical protein